MRPARLMFPILLATALAPAVAGAATYTVFREGTSTILGTFAAPDGGGALLSASFSFGGGVFDLLGSGGEAPSFDPATGFLTGAGGVGFGGVFNSLAFDTVDIAASPVSCPAGACAILLTDGFGGAPGEFSVASMADLGTALGFGFYAVVADPVDPVDPVDPGPAPIPLPASALLLGLGLAGLGAAGAARRGR